jgi:hypothetical protein
MGIDHNSDGSITLHQKKYIQDMLQQLNMTSCNPVILPWRSGDEFNFFEVIRLSLRAFLIAILLGASCGLLSAPVQALRLPFHASADLFPSYSFANGLLLSASSAT